MNDALESRELSNVSGNGQGPQTSLSTAAARNLATTTKSVPQMQEITSRWLLRMLPWVQVSGGTYRVNRRLSYAVGDGRVTFTTTGAEVRVIPQELCELALLRGFGDDEVLGALADRFVQPGHKGEPELPATFVDYDAKPREYELSVAQTTLRVHTRVADLYNNPMNQSEQQLRLTIEALRERQEHELVNNREFGLLHNADLKQRIPTRTGPPTPDDMDEVLSRRRKTRFYLAHPLAIAAFGRECNRCGLYSQSVEVMGSTVHAWRNVPILPCNKIPITESGTTSILVMRTGEEDQGVVGLHQTGIPDEYQPSLNVRFMGIDEKGIINYLVSAYYSAAVLVPDALGILEDVEIGR